MHSFEEQDARAADRADRSPASVEARGPLDVRTAAGLLRLQRTAGNAGVAQLMEGDEDRRAVERATGAGGSPLGASTRAQMERSFGSDFGSVRVAGAPGTAVTIAELAGTGTILLGKGSGEVPASPAVDASACVGRLGIESFLAPQLVTQAARVKVDRETGVVRVIDFAAAHDCGVIINKMGAEGQVLGGVVMGIGQALSEATWFDDQGRQRNPGLLDYKLQTASDIPPIQIRWIEIDTPGAGPKGSKGVGEPPSVPTSGAIGNAIAKVIGRHVTSLPMTAERVWAADTQADLQAADLEGGRA